MSNNTNKEKWNNWFAGLTDGDGCFYINKREGSISYEITTHVTDVRVVQILKHELKGGSVKPRGNYKAVRYRVKAKEIILDIVHRLNGKLHNPTRIEQFKNACKLLNIQPINSLPIVAIDCSYLTGLLDSDGTISLSVSNSTSEDSQESGVSGRITRLTNSKTHNQIYARITSIHREAVDILIDAYGFGCIYVEPPPKKNKNWKTKYHWTIKSEEDFVLLYNLVKKMPLRSVKMHRLRLSMLYFKYKKLKYHFKSPGTIEFKIWSKFCKSWYKYSY